MKQRKKRKSNVGFTVYFRTLTMRGKATTGIELRAVLLTTLFGCLFGFAGLSMNIAGGMFTYLLSAVLFVCSFAILNARLAKPSLNALLPITGRRRAAYSVLSYFVIAISVFVGLLSFVLAFSFLTCIVTGFSLKNGLFLLYITLWVISLWGKSAFANAYSALLSVFYSVYTVGVAFVYAYCDRERNRNLFAACACAVAVTGTAVLTKLATGSVLGDLGENIGNLDYPFLAVTLFGIAAAAAVAGAVYMIVKKTRPGKF